MINSWVSERIENRFKPKFAEGSYLGFEVYPLYDGSDELCFILVEFEPYGYMYVKIRDERLKPFGFLGASTSMYQMPSTYGNNTWSPYSVDETNSQPPPDVRSKWKVDENGKKIEYKRSPYNIAGITHERRYFIPRHGGELYTPAVKRGENFLNLISSEEFELVDGHTERFQAVEWPRYRPYHEFDL